MNSSVTFFLWRNIILWVLFILFCFFAFLYFILYETLNPNYRYSHRALAIHRTDRGLAGGVLKCSRWCRRVSFELSLNHTELIWMKWKFEFTKNLPPHRPSIHWINDDVQRCVDKHQPTIPPNNGRLKL